MTGLYMTDQTEAETALRCRVCQKRISAHGGALANHANKHVRAGEAYKAGTTTYYMGPEPAAEKVTS